MGEFTHGVKQYDLTKEAQTIQFILSKSARRHGDTDLGIQVNFHVTGRSVSETSASSLRMFNLKLIYLHSFYGKHKPFDAHDLQLKAGEDRHFIDRFLRKNAAMNRFTCSGRGWVPTDFAKRRAHAIYAIAGVAPRQADSFFEFILDKKVSTFQIAYTKLSLAYDLRATVLGQSIELALWEAALHQSVGLSSAQLSQRLEVSKSTLSTALQRLIDFKIVYEIEHDEDGRSKILHLNTTHEFYTKKLELIERSLNIPRKANVLLSQTRSAHLSFGHAELASQKDWLTQPRRKH